MFCFQISFYMPSDVPLLMCRIRDSPLVVPVFFSLFFIPLTFSTDLWDRRGSQFSCLLL